MSDTRARPTFPSKSFVFAPKFNQPPDDNNPLGHDATGAFQPGMAAYKTLYEGMGGTVVTHLINNQKVNGPARRAGIINAMQQGCGSKWYDAIVYFGHGDKNFLVSADFSVDTIGDFTAAVQQFGEPSVKVVLYACSCAAPGGIAYRIANDLRGWKNFGMEVYGHPVKGHSFRNAVVRRYPGALGETGDTVAPAGKVGNWIKAMADPKSNLWARFPFMTPREIADTI
jgi:hypothetical protein